MCIEYISNNALLNTKTTTLDQNNVLYKMYIIAMDAILTKNKSNEWNKESLNPKWLSTVGNTSALVEHH